MRSNYLGQRIGKIFFLGWAFLCILYFILFPAKVSFIHWSNLDDWQLLPGKLEGLDLAYDVTSLIRSLVEITIFSIACISLGAFIAKKLKVDYLSNPYTSFTSLALLSTEFLLGQGIFSLVFLTLGGLYQITPKLVSVILFIGFMMGIGELKQTFSAAFVSANLSWIKLENGQNRLIFWLAISTLLISLLHSSARLSYDASALYFSDAKLTAMTQHLRFFKDDAFPASSFQSTIQYAALIQIFGDQTARMLSWLCGVIIVIFSLAIGEKVQISKSARIILLTLLVTSTAFLDLMGDGKVDLISSAPAIAAIYWMIIGRQSETPNKSLLLIIGVLTGLAVIERPFNAFLVGLFIGLYYLQEVFIQKDFKRSGFKRLVTSFLWIGIGACGLGIYHLFANWMILGNPFAFLSSVSNINPSSGPWDYNPQQLLRLRLLYPFTVTFRNTPQSLGNISPAFIAFLPALFIQEIRRKTRISSELSSLLIISIITLLLWVFLFFTVTEIRYVIFLWVILFVPLAEIMANALEIQDKLFQTMVRGLILLLLIFSIWRAIYISLDTYSPIDKQGNPQCSDSRFCEYLKSINEAASLGDRVLMLGAFRYYLRRDLFVCSTRHIEYKTLQALTSQSPEAFWEEVYRQGYKYIAYENDYTTRHLQFAIIPSPGNAPKWIKLEPIFGVSGDLQVAYKINVSNPPVEIEATCQKNSPKGWEIRPPAP